jgi:hypothetical protein
MTLLFSVKNLIFQGNAKISRIGSNGGGIA